MTRTPPVSIVSTVLFAGASLSYQTKYTITPATADAVLMALNGDAEAVLVCERWLADELDLDARHGHIVFVRRVLDDTKKAWEFACDSNAEWILKSQATLFVLAKGVTPDEIDAPQCDLGAFGGGQR